MANAQATEPIRRASALLAAGAPFAAQEQAQLDADFQEFMRTTPEASPWTSQAMQFFGTHGPTATEDQGGNLGMLGAGAGALIGGLLAAPSGGMTAALGAGIGAGIGGGAGGLIKI